jgi:hypothetical protein
MVRDLRRRGVSKKTPGDKRARTHVTVSIGIFSGKTPFDLSDSEKVRNPVLSPEDVTDARAQIVADPFMVQRDGVWYMFFEVFNLDTARGEVGLAMSGDGYDWVYKQSVLREPFHLSYPYVFCWQEKYYMIPESREANMVRLYEALEFPVRWKYVGSLINGVQCVDSTVFQHADIWWMFAETSGGKHDTLRLYYAEGLMGPWVEHPKSPLIVGDAGKARLAGRVTVVTDKLFRFAQDCQVQYGSQVRAFEITNLSVFGYEEREIDRSPVLGAAGSGWNGRGMHHIDPHRTEPDLWIACVDGFSETIVPTS